MLVDEIKTAVRISHTRLDEDIERNIAACFAELDRAGVAVPEDPEQAPPLLRKAAEIWCKWQLDYLGKGEQFRQSFEGMLQAMSLSSGYKATGGAGDV